MKRLTAVILAASIVLFTTGVWANPIPVFEVFASANDGNSPLNTIDGNPATRWSASGDGHWVEFWLSECTVVGSLRIDWYKSTERKAFFAIEIAENAFDWERVFIGESDGVTAGFETFDFNDRLACQVRIVGFGNDSPFPSVSPWNSINEVVIETPPDDPGRGDGVVVPRSLLEELCAPLLPQL